MAVKPIIKYQASSIPINSALNVSIVQKKVDPTTFVNFANKTELTDFIDLLYVPPTSDTYLEIVCQCAVEYVYAVKEDVPATNLVCDCGRKVIEYGVL